VNFNAHVKFIVLLFAIAMMCALAKHMLVVEIIAIAIQMVAHVKLRVVVAMMFVLVILFVVVILLEFQLVWIGHTNVFVKLHVLVI
jgi:hypothetical protein